MLISYIILSSLNFLAQTNWRLKIVKPPKLAYLIFCFHLFFHFQLLESESKKLSNCSIQTSLFIDFSQTISFLLILFVSHFLIVNPLRTNFALYSISTKNISLLAPLLSLPLFPFSISTWHVCPSVILLLQATCWKISLIYK